MDASSSGFSPWDHSLPARPALYPRDVALWPSKAEITGDLPLSPMILTWTGFLEKAHGAETVFH